MHAHAIKVLQKLLLDNLSIHRCRLTVLLDTVTAALSTSHLSLTQLGYALKRQSCAKHRIKCIDRLLGNHQLHTQRAEIYSVISRLLIGRLEQPVILVDWNPLSPDQHWQLRRAAIAIQGRSLTLYEEVHPQTLLNSPRVHRAFLKQLKTLIAEGCQPVIVTDTGYKNPWFKATEALGWHWLGRVRARVYLTRPGDTTWVSAKQLCTLATTQPQCLGTMLLSRSNPLRCRIVLLRRASKGRKHQTLKGSAVASKASRTCARRESDPWLLAASMGLSEKTPQQLVMLYRKRMQIEEGFRDSKSQTLGLGVYPMRNRCRRRLENLFLIAALALFLAYLTGLYAKQQGWSRGFQVNTCRDRSVLSVVTLGILWLSEHPIRHRLPTLSILLATLREAIRVAHQMDAS